MKKIFSCVFAMAIMQHAAFACNMCGCSSGNQYLGLLPQNNSSFAGIQYLYRSFSTIHVDDGSTMVPGTSYEHYQTVQLWGRINVSKRLQVMAFAPYVYNTSQQSGTTSNIINGISDVSVIANYRFIDAGRSWHSKLLAGGGVKAPVGKYDASSFTEEEGLPNMQPGTHSWDFIGNVNYTVKHGSFGLNADVSYVATTANKEDYKFGNRLSAGATIFHEWKKKDLSLLPQLGLRYDRASKDYESYSAKTMDEDGGGWQLYAMQGVQGYYKKIGLQAMCYEPVSQHYASGLVNTKLRVEAGIVLLIN